MTWLELAVRNGGFRQAIRALMWAQTWATAREALDHDPTVEEVAEWWRSPLRSAYREQAAFRACFPTLDTPAPIFEAPEIRQRLRQQAQAAGEVDELVRAIKRRVRPTDATVLQLGMQPARA